MPDTGLQPALHRMDVLAGAEQEGPALISEWWALWRRDPRAGPFQSPAWLIPWKHRFGGPEARVVTLRQNGRLVGLLPVYRHDGQWLLWGAGTSDWLDGVFAPDFDPALLSRALELLDGPLDAFQLPAHSPILALAGTAGTRTAESCPALELPSRLPRSMAQNLRYYRHRAERAGIGAAYRAGPAMFETLVDIHTRRWRQVDGRGVLHDPLVLAWHGEALPLLEAAGLLRLLALPGPRGIAGVLYGLSAKRCWSYYIGGFDPELAGLGPGTLLVGAAIAAAEAEGARRFDFLRGREPYKYRWGAVDRPSYRAWVDPRAG